MRERLPFFAVSGTVGEIASGLLLSFGRRTGHPILLLEIAGKNFPYIPPSNQTVGFVDSLGRAEKAGMLPPNGQNLSKVLLPPIPEQGGIR